MAFFECLDVVVFVAVVLVVVVVAKGLQSWSPCL